MEKMSIWEINKQLHLEFTQILLESIQKGIMLNEIDLNNILKMHNGL